MTKFMPITSTDKDITSIPSEIREQGGKPEQGFGFTELMGKRHRQEDTLAWSEFNPEALSGLTPEQIGQRLWTAHRQINAEIINKKELDHAGSTAVTTVIKNNFLITALLADAAAFVAIYNENAEVISATRLNRRTHTPNLERERIIEAGGCVLSGRVFGSLAVARALGDALYAPSVIADSDISIADLSNIPPGYSVQLISSCDGFTDGAKAEEKAEDRKIDETPQEKQGREKQVQEQYLMNALKAFNNGKPKLASEMSLSEHLAEWAIGKGSADNVSVLIQTVKESGKPACFNGIAAIYDGHGGQQVAAFAADNIRATLEGLFKLTEEEYQILEHSAVSQKDCFLRDNASIPVLDLNTIIKKPEPASNPAPALEKIAAPHSPGFFTNTNGSPQKEKGAPRRQLKRTQSVLDLSDILEGENLQEGKRVKF